MPDSMIPGVPPDDRPFRDRAGSQQPARPGRPSTAGSEADAVDRLRQDLRAVRAVAAEARRQVDAMILAADQAARDRDQAQAASRALREQLAEARADLAEASSLRQERDDLRARLEGALLAEAQARVDLADSEMARRAYFDTMTQAGAQRDGHRGVLERAREVLLRGGQPDSDVRREATGIVCDELDRAERAGLEREQAGRKAPEATGGH